MRAQPVGARRAARACFGLAVATALVASGCAAGQRAQTADQKPTLDGTEASVGQLDLRGLTIMAPTTGSSYPAGATVQVRLVITNSGQSADRLTSITSSAITGWGSYASAADARAAEAARTSTPTPATTPPSSTTAPPSSATTSTSPGSSSSSTGKRKSASTTPASTTAAAPTTSAAPVPQASRSIAIEAGSATSWGVPDSKLVLVLTGIKSRLFSAAAVRLTFTFARAGSVTVAVPVGLTSKPLYSYVPEPSNAGASATD